MAQNFKFKKRRQRASEAGQTTVFFVLVLGIFLLAALSLAFDLSNMWFHRQTAQNAADAACTAGAMDLLVDAQGSATGHQGYTLGSAFDCATTPDASVCQYAAKNGYDSANTTPGNLVSVSFPASVIGVSTPPSEIASTAFIRVDVLEHVQTYFLGLLNGSRSSDVRAFATCGLELAASPIPILVLDPKNPNVKPAKSALDVQGTPDITIVGGPSKSIQVNSNDAAATNVGGSGTIDLSQAGPQGTGANIGIWGGPAKAPNGFKGGSTGHWVSPSAPINDPFAQLATPVKPPDAPPPARYPASGTNPDPLAADANGIVCPDTVCTRYQPGNYPGGICIGSSCGAAPCYGKGGVCNAIFDPGVYYISGDFSAKSNSCLRPSGAPDQAGATDALGGVIFYFTNGGAVNVDANSGKQCNNGFTTGGYAGTSTLLYGVKCTSTSKIIPSGLIPTTLTGNVMLGPCLGTYGDPLGASDPLGIQRGILFFQDRSTLSANQSWGGGGSFLLAGTMYFHSCNSGGTGTDCGAAGTYYNDIFTLQGGSGSTTYVLGDIIADNIALGGNSSITMDLNPSRAFTILKASLLQ